jgi:hypothetical protein
MEEERGGAGEEGGAVRVALRERAERLGVDVASARRHGL